MPGRKAIQAVDIEQFARAPSPCWSINPKPTEHPKAFLITGTPRGGTTFAASCLANLGIPLKPNGIASGGRHANKELDEAFAGRDRARFRRLCEELSKGGNAWAWKAPTASTDLQFVVENVQNPHFIFVFKEPLSVVSRSIQIRDLKISDHERLLMLGNILVQYSTLVSFAMQTDRPVLCISYDRAVTDLRTGVEQIARFVGVTDLDADLIVDRILKDKARYFQRSVKLRRKARGERGQ